MPLPFPDFTPWVPPFDQAMPEGVFDGQIQARGIRLGWLRALTCPCSYGGGNAGSPSPGCTTCRGRGIYWQKPAVNFVGLLTFVTTQMMAENEPGAVVDKTFGTVENAQPILTIPRNGAAGEATVWQQSGRFDAYVELDASSREQVTLVQGENIALPFQLGVTINGVTTWSSATNSTTALPSSQYSYSGGNVVVTGIAAGTPFTVDYMTQPVYVASGPQHIRPFGQGSQNLPKRYHVQLFDLWTRAQAAGDGPLTP